MNPGPASILWFKTDLRIEDNPALAAAAEHGAAIPVYICDEEAAWPPGAASRWWLHQSLLSLDAELRRRGSRLILRKGRSREVLARLVHETRAQRVFCGRRCEADLSDTNIGVPVESFISGLLKDPFKTLNRQGNPYQVFTPYWKSQFGGFEPPPPVRAPERIPAPKTWPQSLRIEKLNLEPKMDWASGIRASWTPGEKGAKTALDLFLQDALAGYAVERDYPSKLGTSHFSPYLHCGEISPYFVWIKVREFAAVQAVLGIVRAEEAFLRQLAWREFAHHMMAHFPYTPDAPLRSDFDQFPWREDSVALEAWQNGRTGYPIVDAGMRELWTTGWMHNRIRMIAASFLVKHLLIPWQHGARWFFDTLVDADLANNTFGWQWIAGCGADAAPYFRVFNPVLQGEKFDHDGEYVRQWLPELRKLPARWIHRPWQAPESVLKEAAVRIGKDYPKPIIDLVAGRIRALEAYRKLRRP